MMDMETMTMTTSERTRAPKLRYDFKDRRGGDVIKVRSAKARAYYLSAFLNWKRDRPGTLKAISVKAEDGYLIRFTGISPAEATEARLTAGDDI